MNDIFFFSFCQILFLIIELDMTDIYITEEELSHLVMKSEINDINY